MKPHRSQRPLLPQFSLLAFTSMGDYLTELWSIGRRKKLPSYLFLALCCNALFAPAVLAATGGDFSRFQAWATALLGIATVSLSAYLFVVMFQPEKF